MHKNIAELIEELVNKSPYDICRCTITPNTSNRFWKCKLEFNTRNDSPSEALMKLVPELGRMFGEELDLIDKGIEVIISWGNTYETQNKYK